MHFSRGDSDQSLIHNTLTHHPLLAPPAQCPIGFAAPQEGSSKCDYVGFN